MSLEPVLPIPSTGNLNVLVSDRKGPDRGVYFLKTDRTRLNHWKRVDLLPDQNEFMFLCQSSPKQSGANQSETDPHQRIVVATRNSFILDIEVKDLKKSRLDKIPNPESIPFGKAVAIGDIDLDGEPDLVHSSNIRWLKNQRSPESGLHWLKKPANRWVSQPITDSRGKKYDRLELIDLDGDGDLDVLTCEETANLGVIWFENPVR